MQHPGDSSLDASWSACFAPRAELGIVEWAIENVRPPNAARTGSNTFDIDPTPWLREPTEASVNPEVRELVMLAPTGGSKTTLADLKIAHALAEESGSILATMQSKEDADAYWDERLEPILLDIPKIQRMVEALAKGKRRKGELMFPGRTLYIKEPSKTTFQRKSVVLIILDEAWRLKHGYMKEARSRLHARWNRLAIIISQGGEAQIITEQKERVDSELEDAWARSHQAKYSMACPECRQVHRWRLRNLKWNEERREDGSFDEAAIIQSARYECPNVAEKKCDAVFQDVPTLRHQLATESIYVPSNPRYVPHPDGHHYGYHVSCLALPHERWSDIALQWTRASHAWKQGDREPRRIFIQQRMAENFREEQEVQQTALALSDYSKAEYTEGQPWEDELCRFLTADVQKDHFWYIVQAWKVDGSSRILTEGRALTFESLREIQERMKVREYFVGIDSKYKTAEVEARCAHWKWLALEGSPESGFPHYPPKGRPVRRYFSTTNRIHLIGPAGEQEICHKVRWSNERIKDILVNLRSGHGAPYGMPSDASAAFKQHMLSEVKRPTLVGKEKRVVERYQPIGGRQNHLWDCASMQVAMACMKRIIRASIDEPEEKTTHPVNR